MRTLLLLVALSLPALADSITAPLTTVQLSGVGSGISGNQFWASDPQPHLDYSLNTTAGSGYMFLSSGHTYIDAAVTEGQISNGVFSALFQGVEVEHIGKGDNVFWDVSGTITQTITLSSATGTGTVSITASQFEGNFPEVPEPSTWLLTLTGLLPVAKRWFRA